MKLKGKKKWTVVCMLYKKNESDEFMKVSPLHSEVEIIEIV